jgi:hypothetical protein
VTVQELVDWCKQNEISLDTHIAVRAKDDYFIVEEGVSFDQAYFGNCPEGTLWEDENVPVDEDGEPDYDNMPSLIILDSFAG